jgi:hypothetical protein
MISYQDFKTFYLANMLLFIILLFVIVYIIINWNKVSNNNYFTGEFVKSILITGIIILIFHMFITWDDDFNNYDNDIAIPKYKFQNNFETNNLVKNEIIAANTNIPQNQTNPTIQSLNNKYRVVNKFDNNLDNINHSNNELKQSNNQSIFISQKNTSKYGLKF